MIYNCLNIENIIILNLKIESQILQLTCRNYQLYKNIKIYKYIIYICIQIFRMSYGIENLRSKYKQLRKRAYNNQMKKISLKDISKLRQESQISIDKMTNANNFQNLQQADFYKDKFSRVQNTMAKAEKSKISVKDYTDQVQQILKDPGFTTRNSYLTQPPVVQGTTSQPQSNPSTILKSFFQQKTLKLVPQVGFKSLLQNPPVSPRTFKKKIGANNNQIDRIRTQNLQLKRQFDRAKLGSGIGGQAIQQQIRRQQLRIRSLQQENQRLLRDNNKLKSEKSSGGTMYSNYNFDDYLYSPYVINPRQNDLGKISMRGSDVDTLSNYNQVIHYQDNQILENNLPTFNLKSQNYVNNDNFDTMSEMDRNKSRFSVFDMSRSHYSDHELNDSKNQASFNQNSRVQQIRSLTRNKVAFFKPSGIILRDNDIQIAYKRSESTNLTGNRIILYFNNKTPQPQKIVVYYQFQANYYDFHVTESIGILEPLKQGRQVIEIKLRNNKQDINSVIQMNIQVNGKRYKLWLPIMFMKFVNYNANMVQGVDLSRKTIMPSKLFCNQNQSQKLINNLVVTGPGQAQFWALSPVHQGPVKLRWKEGNKLEVSTSDKWIDIVTFLMFEYR